MYSMEMVGPQGLESGDVRYVGLLGSLSSHALSWTAFGIRRPFGLLAVYIRDH